VVEGLHDLGLADRVLDLMVGDEILLPHDLHRENLATVSFAALEHSAEGALADDLQELKVFELNQLAFHRLRDLRDHGRD
jgi:hypothetical protein